MARGARRGRLKAHVEVTTALEAALSTEEVTRATAAAFLALDGEGRQRLLEQLPQETAEALRPVLDLVRGRRPGSSAPAAGKGKVREDWQRLWREWRECIDESGYEEGRYVHQDAHWEPPYLDRSAVVDDLERIAKRMRSLLARVWTEGLDPERSFVEEIRAAEDGIGSGLPEWFDGGGEGSGFGPHVTGCLLDWEWRVAQREGLGAFDFIERIRGLEKSLHDFGLDGEAIMAFVKPMPEQDQCAIYEGIKSRRQDGTWSEVLADACSSWFRLHQRLARKWDRQGFTESCRSHINQDWTLALPLVSEQIRRKEFSEALALIDEAMRALLRLEPGTRWDPTRELLVGRLSFGLSRQFEKQAFRLLSLWRRAATAAGDASLAAALDVQCAIGTVWEDWERTLDVFKNARPACEDLFAAWQSMVARASIDRERGDEEMQLGWVRLLVAAAREDMDEKSFVGGTRRWLDRVEKAPGGIERCKGSLATLLLDLDHGPAGLSKRCPKLKKLLEHERRGGEVLARSRRRWLMRLGGRELLPEVLDLLKRHIRVFVPDPASSYSSSYEGCAEWMAAVLEFAPDEYREILAGWQDVHHRRRNLWKAMSARRLPI